MDPSSYSHLLDDLLLIGEEIRAAARATGARSMTCLHERPDGGELVMVSFDEDGAVRATLRGFEFDLILGGDRDGR